MNHRELRDIADDLRLTYPNTSNRVDARLARGYNEVWEMLQKERDERISFVTQALKNVGIDTECCACIEIAFTGLTMTDHSCGKE